ncbi:DUF7678 domain-containing protein [Runella salmonicolor]|uniref:DUF7678 domain-containing protein n=1 Tax=Runella salmonicolor TaxID=2950278 RepID=A0ABT1FJT6_9BACT|nr:hypothetical protein [Runella salmonicolor]MCP1382011.1 hypothetical protein [Runella salmonicolor]
MDTIHYFASSRDEQDYGLYSEIDNDYFLQLKAEQALVEAMNWHGGKIAKYRFEVNVLPKSSKLGINNGRIWKLRIWEGEKGMAKGSVANYDREWQLLPSKELEPHIKRILKLYN